MTGVWNNGNCSNSNIRESLTDLYFGIG